MSSAAEYPGGCACGAVRYVLRREPIFVHACHCRACQRESGSAFVLNGLIEPDAVAIERGETQVIHTPSESGRGQAVTRCPECHVALWSRYPVMTDRILFVRLGTLDDPARFPPDIHIYTSSRAQWLKLPPDIPAVAKYYAHADYWPADALARYQAALGEEGAADG